MGYSTDFTGSMTIAPPLSQELKDEINEFCEDCHGGPSDVFPGMPGFWCDWMTDGDKIFWNGSEKSYSMSEWLQLLIDRYFKPNGHTVEGRIYAQGENPRDRWYIVAKDNMVSKEAAHLNYTE